jgi:hypothetical protein
LQEIIKERFFILLGIIFSGNFLNTAVHSLDNFIINVCNVHDMVDVVPLEFQKTTNQIREDKCSKITYVCKIINSWTTTIKANSIAVSLQWVE